MGVVLTLTIPRLRDPGRAELMSQSKRLVNIFRLLRSEAVLNGYAYRLNYDLNAQRYWVTADESADLGDFVHELGSLARGTQLQDPVGMTDVVLPTLAGKINQGQSAAAPCRSRALDIVRRECFLLEKAAHK